MLKNPNSNIFTISKGVPGYSFFDGSQETTQTTSLMDNVCFNEVF